MASSLPAMISPINSFWEPAATTSFTLHKNQQQVFSLITGTPSMSTLCRTFSSLSARRPETSPSAPITEAGVSWDSTEMVKMPLFSMHSQL